MIAEQPSILSFRHLLTGAIEDFLDTQGMASTRTAEAVGELVVRLSRYREEGASLYPLVFVCDSLEALMRRVDGCDAVPLGAGTESAETIRRALKTCALLGQSGWSMFVERHDGGLRFGMFRTDHFVLRETPMEILRRTNDPSLRALGIVQLADSIVELCGSTGPSRYVYLSGARTDGAPPLVVVRELLTSLARDVPHSEHTDVLTFYRRVMIDVLRAPHGTLIAVLPPDVDPRSVFSDGLVLAEPVDIVAHVRAYRREPTEATRSSVQALNVLLQGMMSSDGITVLRSDGAVLAFNVFVAHPDSLDGHPGAIGGARRRTYETLAAMVGDGLVAAFYRSQDGHTACRHV